MQRILANRVTSLVKTFARNKPGSVMLMSGLMMPVLIGFAGLGLDVTIWYLAKRQIQTAADAGAIAGAHTLAKGGSKGAAQQAVDIDVELNDFAIDATNTSTAHIPPITGAYAGDNNAIEVYVTLSQPLYFAALFGAGPIDIRARAVAAKLLRDGDDPNDADRAVAAARALTAEDREASDLRDEAVGQAASVLAPIAAVRAVLPDYQRSFAAAPPGAAVDGRAIGPVVRHGEGHRYARVVGRGPQPSAVLHHGLVIRVVRIQHVEEEDRGPLRVQRGVGHRQPPTSSISPARSWRLGPRPAARRHDS